MRKLTCALGFLCAFTAGQPALAQPQPVENYLAPPGGLTVKDVVVRNSGWAFVTFQENIPEMSSCEPTTYGTGEK